MSVQVDPIILSKLEEFRKRRRNLIVLRGLCSAVVSLLAVFTVIAVADYLVGMSENLRVCPYHRWLLSRLVYGVANLRPPAVGITQQEAPCQVSGKNLPGTTRGPTICSGIGQ